jgi:hypothetical protein
MRYYTVAGQAAAEKYLASLLFRYAGPDVVSEILPTVQDRSAHPNCEAQDYVLAFLLKVDPDQASPLFRTAVANRPPGHTPCVSMMYSHIGHFFASPILEHFAIEALEDDDLPIATDALIYLRDHGSAQAEQPIFDHLVSRNAKWRDHVSELLGSPVQFDDGDDLSMARAQRNRIERSREEITFGYTLAQALAQGHGWLAGEARIRQLLALTLEPSAKGDLTAALSQLEKPPIHIYFLSNASPGTLFSLAQYQCNSLEDLKNKLTQYPTSTSFIWSDHRGTVGDAPGDQISHDLAQWSAAKGIRISGLSTEK